jgi:TrmH family RNA methyltransferase
MLSKGQIKHLNALKQGKYRTAYGEFIAEGSKLVDELLNSSFRVKAVYATARWLERHRDMLQHAPVEVFRVTVAELERITLLSTAPDVLAVVEIAAYEPVLPDFSAGPVLVLDDIRDPGNLGTIIRTADWFGFKTIFCSPHCVDVFNPKVVQATMGSIARVKVIYTDLVIMLEKIHPGIVVYGAMTEGDNIVKTTLNNHSLIVIGNESNGISPAVIPFIKKKISVPSYSPGTSNTPESLNAAIACAIICFEFRRKATS